jgi:hypothetical protein
MELRDNNFDEFDQELLPYRRDLLPWWIKFFSWLFMILGGFSVLNLFVLFFGVGVNAAIYGLEDVLPAPFGTLIMLLLLIFNGVVGYMLWFEKDQALYWGKIAAITGIVVNIFTTFISFFSGHLMFRFELIALIPFYLKLNSMQYDWEYETRKR